MKANYIIAFQTGCTSKCIRNICNSIAYLSDAIMTKIINYPYIFLFGFHSGLQWID